jgi:hypothetical protein
MTSYCVKCRSMTNSIDPMIVKTKNGRTAEQSKCAVCGTKKFKFISGKGKKGGESLVNLALNKLKLPEMHLIDQGDDGKIRKVNFCGPYTKLDERLKRGDQGINKLDRGCKLHDLAYAKHTDVPNRNVADVALKQVADEVYNDPKSTRVQKGNALFVSKIMGTKKRFGLGHKKK